MTDNIFMAILSKIKKISTEMNIVSSNVSDTHTLLENPLYGLNALKTTLENSSGAINSVQSGYMIVAKGAEHGTATISPVNLDKSFILFAGHAQGFAHVTLDTETSVGCWLGSLASSEVWVYYQVVEFA